MFNLNKMRKRANHLNFENTVESTVSTFVSNQYKILSSKHTQTCSGNGDIILALSGRSSHKLIIFQEDANINRATISELKIDGFDDFNRSEF